MSDDSVASSPPKKRYKQLNIMETMSKAAGDFFDAPLCIFYLINVFFL